MSAAREAGDDSPRFTYADVLHAYAKGRVPEELIRALVTNDEVFSAWLKRRECVTHARLTATRGKQCAG